MDPKFFRRYADLITEAESTPAIPQQSLKAAAQKVAQTLTPEEQKQLQAIIAQVGKNPQAIAQAVGITPQDAQAAVQEGYMAEGIAPTLKGKLIQALHLAAVAAGGLAATGVISDPTWALPTVGMLALMMAPAIWGSHPGANADPQQRDMTPRPGGGSTVVRGVSRNPNQEFANKLGPLKK
jgi:hypothetical protein